MKVKLLFFFISLFIIDLLTSCGCTENNTYHTYLRGIDMNIGDTSHVISSNSEISFEDYRIRTTFIYDNQKISFNEPSGFFIQNAFATKCHEDDVRPIIYIKQISVVSTAEVWGHAALDTIENIDSFFSFYYQQSSRADEFILRHPLSFFIERESYSGPSYMSNAKSYNNDILIELNSHPGYHDPLSFKFVFFLNNGEIITKETEPVKLLE